MTASLAGSTAILKTRYPGGTLPKAQYQKFPFRGLVEKREDFDGNNKQIALQSECPQGLAPDVPTALGSLRQGTYNAFTITRVEYFGIVRIKGQALRAAEKSSGALVNLWRNEMDSVSTEFLKTQEIHALGAGDGVLGQIASGTTGATVTLSDAGDMPKFSLGMRLQAVSATGLSPTVASGYVVVGSINRVTGTLTTVSGNWNAVGNIPAIGATDYLVRAGEAAQSGTAQVMTGVGGYIVGGTTPGTLFSLNRNTDPVRLAGQTYAATSVPYEDALIEAESLRNLQYSTGGDTLVGVFNPRDLAQFRKQVSGKATYPRTDMKSSVADVSFSAINYEGEYGPIKLISSPFLKRNYAYLLDLSTFAIESAGPAPHLQEFTGQPYIVTANDDAIEARFAAYQQMSCNLPSASIQITSFGA